MFQLAAGLGEPWCRDGCIPQGCPLSLVFVALYVPWCWRLEAMLATKLQLYADNLKCSAACPNALFGVAMLTAQHVRSVGQDVCPGKCVLLRNSKAVRKSMKLWDVSDEGNPWKVELDVRYLGGHLDFTERARAGTLSRGLHAVEESCVSASSLSALRAATVRSVWSSKMPLANTPFVLNLLDGPVGVDRAFHVIWTRFRMMREYLAHWPDEVARIFRMLDLIAHGADGHVTVCCGSSVC